MARMTAATCADERVAKVCGAAVHLQATAAQVEDGTCVLAPDGLKATCLPGV